jgi:hypothetical protein
VAALVKLTLGIAPHATISVFRLSDPIARLSTNAMALLFVEGYIESGPSSSSIAGTYFDISNKGYPHTFQKRTSVVERDQAPKRDKGSVMVVCEKQPIEMIHELRYIKNDKQDNGHLVAAVMEIAL